MFTLFYCETGGLKTATTSLIPLHVGKNCTAGSSIARIIQYVKNPAKTQGESLVTGYGCNPGLADAEFMYMKKVYLDRTGRYRGKDDVIAYHMRQSFLPGEITPEEANRLGQELARRFTHGNNAYIVATHTDRHHIHNHIISAPIRGRVNPLSKRQV
nr:relaxase/mobilization nuclease domain-containing protein [Clostridia bacterium]